VCKKAFTSISNMQAFKCVFSHCLSCCLGYANDGIWLVLITEMSLLLRENRYSQIVYVTYGYIEKTFCVLFYLCFLFTKINAMLLRIMIIAIIVPTTYQLYDGAAAIVIAVW